MGDITYPDFKAFIEAREVDEKVSKAPKNLVGCLMNMRLDAWFTEADVTSVHSPRSWRTRLEDMEVTSAKGKSSPKSPKKKGGVESPKKGAQNKEAADEE